MLLATQGLRHSLYTAVSHVTFSAITIHANRRRAVAAGDDRQAVAPTQRFLPSSRRWPCYGTSNLSSAVSLMNWGPGLLSSHGGRQDVKVNFPHIQQTDEEAPAGGAPEQVPHETPAGLLSSRRGLNRSRNGFLCRSFCTVLLPARVPVPVCSPPQLEPAHVLFSNSIKLKERYK